MRLAHTVRPALFEGTENQNVSTLLLVTSLGPEASDFSNAGGWTASVDGARSPHKPVASPAVAQVVPDATPSLLRWSWTPRTGYTSPGESRQRLVAPRASHTQALWRLATVGCARGREDGCPLEHLAGKRQWRFRVPAPWGPPQGPKSTHWNKAIASTPPQETQLGWGTQAFARVWARSLVPNTPAWGPGRACGAGSPRNPWRKLSGHRLLVRVASPQVSLGRMALFPPSRLSPPSVHALLVSCWEMLSHVPPRPSRPPRSGLRVPGRGGGGLLSG